MLIIFSVLLQEVFPNACELVPPSRTGITGDIALLFALNRMCLDDNPTSLDDDLARPVDEQVVTSERPYRRCNHQIAVRLDRDAAEQVLIDAGVDKRSTYNGTDIRQRCIEIDSGQLGWLDCTCNTPKESTSRRLVTPRTWVSARKLPNRRKSVRNVPLTATNGVKVAGLLKATAVTFGPKPAVDATSLPSQSCQSLPDHEAYEPGSG